MSRNFGMSAQQPAGGTADHRALAAQYSTRADSSNAKFDERQINALVFAALCAVSPFAFAVLCLSIYRLVMA